MTRTRIESLHVKIGVTLITHDCPTCGVIFALTEEFEQRRRTSGNCFYCPNGHSLGYEESAADKAIKKAKRLEEENTRLAAQNRHERDQRKAAERSLSATRGVVTKLRKRAQAGVCPFGCHRHFDDLERHIATKHAGERFEQEGAEHGAG